MQRGRCCSLSVRSPPAPAPAVPVAPVPTAGRVRGRAVHLFDNFAVAYVTAAPRPASYRVRALAAYGVHASGALVGRRSATGAAQLRPHPWRQPAGLRMGESLR